MFTGLVKDIGTITAIEENPSGKEFIIRTNLINEIVIDDSVATNGVCLTATELDKDSFKVQAVHVTLEKTSLGNLSLNDPVNLELAMRPMDRLGGHIVQGHVNGLATLTQVKQLGDNWEMDFECPQDLMKYFINEGSVALDGISLTVAKVLDKGLRVSIIPHTYENTTLGIKKIGDSVNIEVDMMAKYLENFMRYDVREN